jgi:hypothetical protein
MQYDIITSERKHVNEVFLNISKKRKALVVFILTNINTGA